MVFLLGGTGQNEFTVRGAAVGLRPLRMSDYAAWASVRSASRSDLTPFEPKWSELELTRAAFRIRVKAGHREAAEDLGHAFGIFAFEQSRCDLATLVGGVSLANLRRGVTQSAEVGYWLGSAYRGRGFMTEAVHLVIGYAIGTLELHRLEAATLPDNHASINVLLRNGFRREGEARSYLKINGAWRDHLLFGLVEDEVRQRMAPGAAGVAARGWAEVSA